MPCPSCGGPTGQAASACPRCGAALDGGKESLASTAAVPVPRVAFSAPKARPAPRPRARISAIGREGQLAAEFLLDADKISVGSQVPPGEVRLEGDPTVAPLHAHLRFDAQRLWIEDAGGPNGVFLWVRERELSAGEELRIGRQRLRLGWMPAAEPASPRGRFGSPDPGYVAQLVQLFEGGGEGDVFPLRAGENTIGRAAGDVSFPADSTVSSRHALLVVRDGRFHLRDLGSVNGTYVKLTQPTPLSPGDLLLVGEMVLRVDAG